MTYTDGTHLVADTLEELHEFARRIGLKREWFQGHSDHPHYDTIASSKKQLAIKFGAVIKRPREILLISKLMK